MKLEARKKLTGDAKLTTEAGKLKATGADLDKAQQATKAIMKTLAIKESADPGVVAKEVEKVMKKSDEAIKERDEKSKLVLKLENNLKTVNDAIVKAGGKDGDIKGIAELVAVRDAAVKDRDAAAKDRDTLNSAIDAALKELKDANLLTTDTDKTKQLVESTKKARFAGQSPIGSSLGAMVSGLGALTKEPLGIFKKALDNAKTAADLKATQLQLALAESPDDGLDTIVAGLKDRATA